MTVNLKQIADLVSGELVGDPGTLVSGVSSIPDAGPGDLVFAESTRHLQDAENSPAVAVLTRHKTHTSAKALVLVNDPRAAFAAVLELFAPKAIIEPGIHPAAHVAPSAEVGEGASIGFCAYVGEQACIGRDAVILPFVHVGDGVHIGDGSVIHPHVTLYPGCRVGQRVIIHGGSVIGADGFGYNQFKGQHQKIPHIGGVQIDDDVEIGANVTIDRARTGFTEIGAGTKIDNLVHVAHNVKVGRNCILVAQVGISGSVTMGDGVVFAGQSGAKDHVTIGDGVQIAARAGVISDIPTGAKVAGFPARRYGEELRIWACLGKLPDLVKQVKELEDQVANLKRPVDETGAQ